jgi:hypothetical protein
LPKEASKIRHQFSIARLLLLTTATAVILGISLKMERTFVAFGILPLYFLLLTYWLILRGPTVTTGLFKVYRRYRQLKEQRGLLQAEIDRHRNKGQGKSD